MDANCIFCRIINKEIPSKRVVETDDIIVINDIAPKAPIHQLIIPKKHVEDIRVFSAEDLKLGTAMFTMAQSLSQAQGDIPFRLLMNNGHQAGQKVFHAHLHFLAGTLMVD